MQQNQANNKNDLEEVIKEKLKLSDDTAVRDYCNTVKVASNFLPVATCQSSNSCKDKVTFSIYQKCNLSYPFLIQHSLVDNILNKAITGQIGEELSEVNSRLELLSSQKEEKIMLIKNSSSSETKLENELDEQSPSYVDLNEQIKELEKRKAKLEEIKEDKDTKIKLLKPNSVKERFEKELVDYIRQLGDSHAEGVFSKFTNQDNQHKIRKTVILDKAKSRLFMCAAASVAMSSPFLICLAFLMIFSPFHGRLSWAAQEQANREFYSMVNPLFKAVLVCSLLAVLFVCIAGWCIYKSENLKRNLKKELNYNDQKLNSELNIEKKLKINTEQSERIIPQLYPNLLEEAPQDKDMKLEFTNLIIENSYKYSTAHGL